MSMRHRFFIYIAMGSSLLAGVMNISCSKDTPAEKEDASILFHVKSQQYVVAGTSRAIVEDTEELLNLEPPIYVSDENSASGINNRKIDFLLAGIWRDDNLRWNNNLTYTFYGYVSLPEPNQGNSSSGPYISNSQNGRYVEITQPDSYDDDPDHWADYLLSYRVSARGADRPIVNLQFERVTAGVELYITRGSNIPDAKVTRIAFSGVKRKTRMTLTNHATNGDSPGATGMKNLWSNATENETVAYVKQTTEPDGFQVPEFEEAKGKYHTDYRFMRFLTVPQTLGSVNTLEIAYQVLENNTWQPYDVMFSLDSYKPAEWTIGHKMRYYLNIDTSMELQAVVERWDTSNVIEGTFIPD